MAEHGGPQGRRCCGALPAPALLRPGRQRRWPPPLPSAPSWGCISCSPAGSGDPPAPSAPGRMDVTSWALPSLVPVVSSRPARRLEVGTSL